MRAPRPYPQHCILPTALVLFSYNRHWGAELSALGKTDCKPSLWAGFWYELPMVKTNSKRHQGISDLEGKWGQFWREVTRFVICHNYFMVELRGKKKQKQGSRRLASSGYCFPFNGKVIISCRREQQNLQRTWLYGDTISDHLVRPLDDLGFEPSPPQSPLPRL